ncbi:unnamed protein product [Polarella glacialis]|uniref:Uncharacterized protein n=1 Tax=Polarella glacialis TaxID=89957 RepID=A0A813D849_POLGL|nr:unnamed protein product [Polarella glacialis]CAE8646564.1 unnamed protein product [Polarella glacialis]
MPACCFRFQRKRRQVTSKGTRRGTGVAGGLVGNDEQEDKNDEDGESEDGLVPAGGCFSRGKPKKLADQRFLHLHPDRTPADKFRLLCAQGQLAQVKSLLAPSSKTPLQVDAATDNGYTGLHAAAARGHLEMVSLLLAQNANPNSTASRGMTALMLAACGGHAEVVELLLNQEANPTDKIPGERGISRTAFDLADGFGQDRVAEILKRYSSDSTASEGREQEKDKETGITDTKDKNEQKEKKEKKEKKETKEKKEKKEKKPKEEAGEGEEAAGDGQEGGDGKDTTL